MAVRKEGRDHGSAFHGSSVSRSTGHDDEKQDHGDEPPSRPSKTDAQEHKRKGDGLHIGAPLTAAFIGGFLVIENLAGADQGSGIGIASSIDDTQLFDEDSGDPSDDIADQAQTAGTTMPADDAAGRGDDPAASPSEDTAIDVGAEGVAFGPDSPAIAATASTVQLPDSPDSGGDANLNFFNINIGTGEDDLGGDAIVEDDILRRNREVGTPGDDVLNGGSGDDAISGGSGDDIIYGNGGRDLLNGNEGDDQLFGGAGEDNLKGGAGDDVLDGGADYDNLLGGSGDDVLIINGRHDVALDYDGPVNSGEDLLIVRQGYADDLAESGIEQATFFYSENIGRGDGPPAGTASHTQQVARGIEHVTLEGSADHDIVADSRDNRLTGNDGGNVIHAEGGDDHVSGGGGRDDLRGGDGDDELFGGAGDDVISGGKGEDRLFGEGGDDTFVVGLNDSAIDTIFDHEGANRLKLNGVTDQTIKASILDDDLYITADDVPVAKVSGYVGHEESLAGVDFGDGLRGIDTLLVDSDGLEEALDHAESSAAAAAADDLLAAHLHLTEPTVVGDPRSDQRLDGTAEDDWLSGFDGRDVLFGHDGNDILEGGDGADRLAGGAGDDRYVFSKGESGIDKIDDDEGRNLAELKGYDHAEIDGAMLGDDLAVLADGKVLFTVDDYASSPETFKGVQAGNRFVETEDLLA